MLCDLEIYLFPHTVLFKDRAQRVDVVQLEPGSGEEQPTQAVGDKRRKNRSESGGPIKGKGLRVFWTYRHLGVHRRSASRRFECLVEVHPLVVQ